MQCSDLERYLEAYLDLRLGRSRGAILRRHLSACHQCRARVDHLRAFERDLQHSFRAMERAQSVWAGLEPDLVRSGGLADAPPVLPFLGPADLPRRASASARTEGRSSPQFAGRLEVTATRARVRRASVGRWGQRVAGLALLIAASLGASALIWRAWSGNADPGLLAYTQWRGDHPTVQFPTSDAQSLHDWLVPWLGEHLPELPVPAGFELIGGTVEDQVSPARGLVVYRHDGESTLLLVWPRPDEPASAATPVADESSGLSQLRWSHSGYGYTVVSPLPEAELLPFTLVDATPL